MKCVLVCTEGAAALPSGVPFRDRTEYNFPGGYLPWPVAFRCVCLCVFYLQHCLQCLPSLLEVPAESSVLFSFSSVYPNIISQVKMCVLAESEKGKTAIKNCQTQESRVALDNLALLKNHRRLRRVLMIGHCYREWPTRFG